jgi:hypothetical protein
MLLSLGFGAPVVLEYLKTGLVPRLPTAVLSTGLMLLAFLSLASGLILDTVTRGRWELKRLAYLAVKNPHDLKLSSGGGYQGDWNLLQRRDLRNKSKPAIWRDGGRVVWVLTRRVRRSIGRMGVRAIYAISKYNLD